MNIPLYHVNPTGLYRTRTYQLLLGDIHFGIPPCHRVAPGLVIEYGAPWPLFCWMLLKKIFKEIHLHFLNTEIDKYSWNPFSWKTMVPCIVNPIAVDGRATLGAVASAAMVYRYMHYWNLNQNTDKYFFQEMLKCCQHNVGHLSRIRCENWTVIYIK